MSQGDMPVLAGYKLIEGFVSATKVSLLFH